MFFFLDKIDLKLGIFLIDETFPSFLEEYSPMIVTDISHSDARHLPVCRVRMSMSRRILLSVRCRLMADIIHQSWEKMRGIWCNILHIRVDD